MNRIIQQIHCESGQHQYWVATDCTEFEEWCRQYPGKITIFDQQASHIDTSQHMHWYSIIIADDQTAAMFILRWA